MRVPWGDSTACGRNAATGAVAARVTWFIAGASDARRAHAHGVRGMRPLRLVVLHHLRRQRTEPLLARRVARMRAQELGRRAAAHLAHLLPQRGRGTRVVASL